MRGRAAISVMRRGLAFSLAAILATSSPAVAQSTLNRAGLLQQSGISLGSNNQNKLTAAGVQTILNLVIGNTANLNDANTFTGADTFTGPVTVNGALTLSALPSCNGTSSVAPVPTGQAFQCSGVILIAQ